MMGRGEPRLLRLEPRDALAHGGHAAAHRGRHALEERERAARVLAVGPQRLDEARELRELGRAHLRLERGDGEGR